MGEEAHRILSVGLACADLVNLLEYYPREDTGQRCLDQYWQRGGNASNNCTVLSMLGEQCEFMGTLATSHEAQFLTEDFQSLNINTEHCVHHQGCRCPMSTIIINQENGSRTILHANRDLPELTAEEFRSKLDLDKYSWIHFEGRPTAHEVRGMLQCIDEYNKTAGPDRHVTTSVELEKTRKELVGLEDSADYVFLSKEHCAFRGFSSKEAATEVLINTCREKSAVICPWGEQGAIARTKDGKTFTAPLFPPDKVMDTTGAGDTFIAATITRLNKGEGLGDAIVFGSKVAGAKVGMLGFSGLKELFGT